jgi:general secretion pathway protein G
MQMQAEIPSGAWPLEQLPSRLSAIGRKLRDGQAMRKLAATMAITVVMCVGTFNLSAYLLRRHRESVLRSDLSLLRATIREYTADEHHAPHRLMDLVEQGYMLEMPPDPFTGKPDWDPDFAEIPESIDREHFGIVDVHSRSTDRGRDGSAYCQW